jgi:hypothetical protein
MSFVQFLCYHHVLSSNIPICVVSCIDVTMFSFCVEYIQWITLRRNYVVSCNHVQFLCRIYSVTWIGSNHVQFSECHDLFSYLDRQYAET